mgnify:CR=1 FL=1
MIVGSALKVNLVWELCDLFNGLQLGSGGKEIGEKLAARLGIDFYDKELINLASEESVTRHGSLTDKGETHTK